MGEAQHLVGKDMLQHALGRHHHAGHEEEHHHLQQVVVAEGGKGDIGVAAPLHAPKVAPHGDEDDANGQVYVGRVEPVEPAAIDEDEGKGKQHHAPQHQPHPAYAVEGLTGHGTAVAHRHEGQQGKCQQSTDGAVVDILPRHGVGDMGARDTRQLDAAEDDGEDQREERGEVVARSHLEHHRREHLERAPQLEHTEQERQPHHQGHEAGVQARHADERHTQGAGKQYLPCGEAELQTEEQREGHGDAYHGGKATHQYVLGVERQVTGHLCRQPHEDAVAHLEHDGEEQYEPEPPPLGHEVAEHRQGESSLLLGHSVYSFEFILVVKGSQREISLRSLWR